jgi:hypothetical protein
VRLGQLASLDAGIAAEYRVLGVTPDGDWPPLLDINQHCAIGVAEAAESAACFHSGSASIIGRDRTLGTGAVTTTVTFGG